MANSFFQFKQFIIQQDRCAMKVTTDACLFGAWVAAQVSTAASANESIAINGRRLLDIGAGTGLLSLMIAQKWSGVVDAIEIDKDAFEQASENSNASPWKERIKLFHGDARIFSLAGKYDIIVSNPPFYENELKSTDEKKNIAHHGGLGLSELLNIIVKNLEPDGRFFLLVPAKRALETAKLIEKYGLRVTKSVMVRQSVNHGSFRVMIEGVLARNKEARDEKTEIAIVDGQQQYSPQFVELLKDYYLHL